MPASEVMHLYRQHKLHSGPGGPIVKTKKQATAIQISMARKEGHHIPVRGSLQSGGTAGGGGSTSGSSGGASSDGGGSAGYTVHRGETVTDSTGSTDLVPEPAAKAIKPGGPELGGKLLKKPPAVGEDPQLAAMAANVASPLHRVEGFKHGGTIPRTGIYRLHAGEHVIPASLARRYREMKR